MLSRTARLPARALSSDSLRLTEVTIFPVEPDRGLIAFAAFVVNDLLHIGNIGVHRRLDRTGYRLVYPTKQLPGGRAISIVRPICRQADDLILAAILRELDGGDEKCEGQW